MEGFSFIWDNGTDLAGKSGRAAAGGVRALPKACQG
jgi:hypothetical protein